MDKEKTDSATSQVYRQEFQPDCYLSRYYTGRLEAGVEFILQNHHKFFTLMADTMENGDEGVIQKTVLEIGSGPVPIHVLSASGTSSSIVCSDYLEANRKKLLEWLSPLQGLDIHDKWIPYAKYVAELESLSCERCERSLHDALSLLNRVQRSVKAVVPCDVAKEDPLMGNPLTAGTSFDVVISVFCIEVAVDSLQEFCSAVKNVSHLIRPSGYLLMVGGLGGTNYYIQNRPMPRLGLSREKVESALMDAGCLVRNWYELPRSCRPPELPIDYTAMYYCVAQKSST